jgi:glucose-6-phosphate 1-dehydrogenase
MPAIKNPEPCVIVIFGASGDLTSRKLVPALYEMAQIGLLPAGTCVLGVSRSPMSDDDWRGKLQPWAKQFAKGYDDDKWKAFAQRLSYHAADATKVDEFTPLQQ